jgi:hypothetical protein
MIKVSQVSAAFIPGPYTMPLVPDHSLLDNLAEDLSSNVAEHALSSYLLFHPIVWLVIVLLTCASAFLYCQYPCVTIRKLGRSVKELETTFAIYKGLLPEDYFSTWRFDHDVTA